MKDYIFLCCSCNVQNKSTSITQTIRVRWLMVHIMSLCWLDGNAFVTLIGFQKLFVKLGSESCKELERALSRPKRVRHFFLHPGLFFRHDSLMPGLSLDHYTSPSVLLGRLPRLVVTSENTMFLMSSPQEMGVVFTTVVTISLPWLTCTTNSLSQFCTDFIFR